MLLDLLIHRYSHRKDSNFKTKISSITKFDFDLQVNSTVENIRTWKDDVGKLNVDSQRIHDNDYYQRFSYSVREQSRMKLE